MGTHKFEKELQMQLNAIFKCFSINIIKHSRSFYAFRVTRALCHHYLSIEAFHKRQREGVRTMAFSHLRYQMFVYGRAHFKMHYFFSENLFSFI
jgi:hypothetical protein